MTSTAESVPHRVVAIDVFRGLVMLLLIPDTTGGFGFYRMAAQDPGSGFWSALAAQFTHAPWTGVRVWDLIMPSFVMLAGASIPLSWAARKSHGESDASAYTHAALRSAALILLGLTLSLRANGYVDEIWPLVFLFALGLPVADYVARAAGIESAARRQQLSVGWWVAVLLATAWHILRKDSNPGIHESGTLLVQLGLAYLPAFLLVKLSSRSLVAVGLALLGSYWLAFFLYPLPPDSVTAAAPGVMPGDGAFSGYFAHWNKNTNLASAFDSWFFNLWPRTKPYLPDSHGYQTLNFVPMIATLIAGMLAGRIIRERGSLREVRNWLVTAGAVLVGAGLLGDWFWCPMVKSIWTPSWSLFSSGSTLLGLALIYQICEVRGLRRWTLLFVVVGSNSILLYTLAMNFRWRLLEPWQRLLPGQLIVNHWQPLIEALLVGCTLWLGAYVLYRRRILVRI